MRNIPAELRTNGNAGQLDMWACMAQVATEATASAAERDRIVAFLRQHADGATISDDARQAIRSLADAIERLKHRP